MAASGESLNLVVNQVHTALVPLPRVGPSITPTARTGIETEAIEVIESETGTGRETEEIFPALTFLTLHQRLALLASSSLPMTTSN